MPGNNLFGMVKTAPRLQEQCLRYLEKNNISHPNSTVMANVLFQQIIMSNTYLKTAVRMYENANNGFNGNGINGNGINGYEKTQIAKQRKLAERIIWYCQYEKPSQTFAHMLGLCYCTARKTNREKLKACFNPNLNENTNNVPQGTVEVLGKTLGLLLGTEISPHITFEQLDLLLLITSYQNYDKNSLEISYTEILNLKQTDAFLDLPDTLRTVLTQKIAALRNTYQPFSAAPPPVLFEP